MTSTSSTSLTILMLTQNRPLFVKRALKFYSQELLPYKILIIDSSSKDNKTEVQNIVRNADLNIFFCDHEYVVGANSTNKFAEALSKVDSEYVLMVADDDFVFPSAIHRCVEFLNHNPNYTAASGRSYEFELDAATVVGNIKSIVSYPQSSAENNLAERRFKLHMKNWTTSAYSVQRTKNLRDIVNTHRKFSDDIRMMEIHWYATNVIRGKVIKLDIPYMFRQSALVKEWSVDDLFNWNETFKLSGKRELLVNLLARELADTGSKSLSYYRAFCDTILSKWIKTRRPFLLKNCSDYSMNYYWSKFNEKMGRNTFVRRDLEAVERIRLAVSG